MAKHGTGSSGQTSNHRHFYIESIETEQPFMTNAKVGMTPSILRSRTDALQIEEPQFHVVAEESTITPLWMSISALS